MSVMGTGIAMASDATTATVDAKSSNAMQENPAYLPTGEDQALPLPAHPPIDTIPPMPMPNPDQKSKVFVDQGPGQPVFYDIKSGKQTLGTLPDARQLENQPSQGGGYEGTSAKLPQNTSLDSQNPDLLPNAFSSMVKVANYTDDPWRKNVKLVMRFEDASQDSHYYVCSGTMRDAEVVQTAGHCVYDRDNSYGWAKDIWVYPAYDGDSDAYGYGKTGTLVSWTGWTNSGDWNYDVGAVAITRAVGMLTGWFGWASHDCTFDQGKTWNNASYPAEDCGDPGLHNGKDMYYWGGTFDSCPDTNRRQIDTTGGCFDALWGGQSGSGAYYIDNGSRYVGAVASTSNRSTIGVYTTTFDSWVTYLNDTFIPGTARGSVFDIQALNTRLDEVNLTSGDTTAGLKHMASNPTNGTSASAPRNYKVYLSTNDNITSFDTLLSSQSYTWEFAAMQNVTINMVNVQIPLDTPTGDYWLGVIYDNGTDGDDSNNDTNGWDAAKIHVTQRQTFLDVPTNHWAWLEIEKLVAAGITSGCDANHYCPGSAVNRAQMAIFLERGINGSSFVPPAATGTMFGDVPASHWAAAWIERLASDGITGGCGGGNYCPDNIVSRAQMAIFLLRSEHGSSYTPPAATGTMFGDVPASHWAAAWIEQLANEGITGGCGGGNYCPDTDVNRDQMAVFLTKTFNL
ncbi:S-layer homology domain-containing protein [Thiolapillus brandeum]|nr:S-layer homology domain-containing protein [Thiolapillus brandeum]